MEQEKGQQPKYISKTKYNSFKKYIESLENKDDPESILKKFCEIFDFNPNVSFYTKEKGEKNRQWRKDKAKELGVSQYRINLGLSKLKIKD
jgi:hypothetical protein